MMYADLCRQCRFDVLWDLVSYIQVIMGTLILSVVGNSLVAWAEGYLPGRRRAIVAIMYAVIIAALIGIGVVYIPRFTQEGGRLIARIQVSPIMHRPCMPHVNYVLVFTFSCCTAK